MEMPQKFIIEGGRKLNGTIKVGGSKNAALPILCAALLCHETVKLTNVPQISDIRSLVTIFEALGVQIKFEGTTLEINASNLNLSEVPEDLICSMRASMLLFGPLLSRFDEVTLPFPGGCVLGKRSIFSHTHALQSLGAQVVETSDRIQMKMIKRQSAIIIMPELSVTATENAIMLAALTPGLSQIRLAAAEPHVQDLCHFLNQMGAKISGIGNHFLQIEGVEKLHGTEYAITGDYLEAGTYAIAGLLTQGELRIEGIPTNQLDSLWQKFAEMGASLKLEDNAITVSASSNLVATTIRTAVYPSFPTDLQAPFSVLLTQAEGESQVFETLFEGRLNYLFELEKMGANIQMLNPHQATIKGKTQLHGVPIASIDIRAGAAMVLAALCAEGTTEISNIKYIDRGYERLEEKLTSLGASMRRL